MAVIGDILFYGVTFVLMVLAMWLTAKVLKFKKQDTKPAAFVAVVYVAIGYALGQLLDAVNPSGTSSEMDPVIYGLLSLAILILAWVLSIKIFYKEGWLKTIAAFVISWVLISIIMIVLGVAFWQMDVFSL
jgi:hypothetical protein